jgi:hypothetical protein
LVEQFLAAPKYDPQPLIEMLRDNLWMGWPDQAMLEFFKAVWEANQALPKERRLRVVLVDVERPWKQITKRGDWKKYDVERNQFMADNVLRDLREHSADPRDGEFDPPRRRADEVGRLAPARAPGRDQPLCGVSPFAGDGQRGRGGRPHRLGPV